VTFERTHDAALVRAIMTDPALYKYGSDDYSPPPAEFRPSMLPGIWYVLVRDDAGALLGMFILAMNSTTQWEIHTRLLPRAWGPRSVEAMRGVCRWAFRRISGCRRIVGAVPVTNRLACRFAERAGFEVWGVNRASVLLGGELVDQIHFGISPEQLNVII
jgi:RimJ/RimL family protein N-acetyltransferase